MKEGRYGVTDEVERVYGVVVVVEVVVIVLGSKEVPQ